MTRINLLPHREAARKRREDAFKAALAVSVLLGGLMATLVYFWFESQISGQQQLNGVLSAEIARLESQIKEIANLESEIAALRARQQAVEDLQADRNQPVHLLDELARQLPDGVSITTLRQENQGVTLQGVAQSNERVSELLKNIGNNTPWFTRPELLEIVAGSLNVGAKEQRRVANFTIRLQMVRAVEAAKSAAGPARGPEPAAAARK